MGRRHLYFGYGSNLDTEHMRKRCGGRFFTIAYLPNYRLAFTLRCWKWPGGWAADVVSSKDSIVWGAVYELSDSQLERLDKSEGLDRSAYIREKVTVYRPNGKTLLGVWTYFVKAKGEGKPAKAYIEILIRGARQIRLPQEYIKFLESIETVD